MVAQRRDDIPFDLRGYKNHVYTVEFASIPSLTDDLSAEMAPFLAAALKDEVLFGNPYSDFVGDSGSLDADADEDEGGLLDRILEFQRRAHEFTEALERAIAVSERFNGRQVALTERMNTVPEGVDPLEHIVAVVDEVGALWTETADELEPILDLELIPIALVIERGAKAMMVVASRRDPGDEPDAGIAALKTLAASAADASEGQATLARLTRENLKYAAALRKPGVRLAAAYDRFASNFERIAALGNMDTPDN